jgi:predicted esterase
MSSVRSLLFVALPFALSFPAWPADTVDGPCAGKDSSSYVAGGKECLVYKAFGGKAPLLAVFLHGDVSAGGPADYLFRYAKEYARPGGVVGVALVRPGYYDAENHRSTGDDHGRGDNYTEHNIGAIADAIVRLKDRFGAARVALIGHSGGAAVAGVILGRHPGLASGAVLFSCPCDLEQHARDRRRRRPYQSLSPHSFASQIPQGTRVIAVSGSDDSVVYSHLSKRYAEMLAARGVRAEYREIQNATHSFATLAQSPVFSEVLTLLLEDVARLGKE